MSVLRGFGFSNSEGIILDIFHFLNSQVSSKLSAERQKELQHFIVEAIEGNLPVGELLEGKEQSPIFHSLSPNFKPEIYFILLINGCYFNSSYPFKTNCNYFTAYLFINRILFYYK